MRRCTRWTLWLLLPHGVSALCFGAAFWWMGRVGTNRSEPDLMFALGGYGTGGLAVLSSVVAIGLVLARRHDRSAWPWLGLHLMALCGIGALGIHWFGTHIA